MSRQSGSGGVTYRVSALARALLAMWHRPWWALAAIGINLIIQKALVQLDLTTGTSPAFWGVFAVSTLACIALYAVLTASALVAVDRDGVSACARIRRNLVGFAAWTMLQLVLVFAAILLHPALVVAVAAATTFWPIAAMDGRVRPWLVNFQVIGARFWRWLATVAVVSLVVAPLFLLAALNTFFIKGTAAAALFWLVAGLFGWWLLTAWALIYRVEGERRDGD